MKINLLAFGQIVDITGKTNWRQQLVLDTEELIEQLHALYPALKEMNYAMALNKKLIHENTRLKENDTVALLPPFSGG